MVFIKRRPQSEGGKFMNKWMIAKMCCNLQTLSNFFKIHKRFSHSKKYRLRNMFKCGWNAIKHDRLVQHQGSYIFNSFLPPLNSPAFLNMAMQVPGEGADFFENHFKGKRLAPISTYIAATGKCRYNCWHCSAHASIGQNELNTESLIAIVRKLQDLGVGIIGFTGGEPLLREDLEQVIASVDQQKSISLVFSTGFGLTQERAAGLKAAGLFGIAFSLDSINKEKHDKMRGYPGAYDHSLRAIRNAMKAGLYTMSQTVCTRELMTSGEILALAKMLKQEGIDEMRILEPLPCGKLSGPNPAFLSLSEQNDLKNLHITLNSDRQYPKASVFPYFESADQFGCGAGSQHSYVDTAGNFGPCDFLDCRYGNLFTEDIKEVWYKMHKAVGGPKCACLAKNPNQCNYILPKYYRLLEGSAG
jgi:MoaA/NifB/PqqE/SkfB family radical SAM enzyme